ncbi:Molybdopterin or thiamine biosynthesis adenylyltransferase (ThiF) (PDB:1ZUD) (PUBMED:32239579) [Commensalibacter communis]|uniref:HesA/MoeB/ThiF family protein n=1 Tax=Commensalibacter communis TaxID=2972786 RepID=UPI0022FFB341|nr:HesA/MoeB/ThiF family protein [Commensalibacter communis]CAI3937556.1 Molybdopterin or thiamine biosynthesis adenylyltransferase (ThiF) (PDB:1ZUD) (PUBMED:32239579) [Commensalibacter communis]CAI3938768.1 Molybdopterin or thiamine biosynthesis adenylyltransferase (ThiF) (PDB:1ZUD) (PUBMED:32239579) [Commensalibacter communis]
MMQRYERQMKLPEIGKDGQYKLQAARVLVVGCGGLGCTVLPLLCGAGVGYIRLYDHDIVEEHNLHRQTLYRMEDIGKGKAICAKAILHQSNPHCEIEVHQERLTPGNVRNALQNIDLVIDASDSFMVTYTLSDACLKQSLPLISASVIERHGYVGGFCNSAPSYRALFPKMTLGGGNCSTIGVMGPIVSILGAIQAQMALSVLLDFTPTPLGQLINVDCRTWRFSEFRFDKAQEPKDNNVTFIDYNDLLPEDCVVELRDIKEAPQSVRTDVIRLLPSEIVSWQPPLSQRIVCVCKTGVRAARAAYALQEKTTSEIVILVDDK